MSSCQLPLGAGSFSENKKPKSVLGFKPGLLRQNAIALPLVPTITVFPRKLFLLIKSFERLEKKPLKLTVEVHLLIISRAGTGLGPNPKAWA